jgi:hypothetical protein
MKAREINLYKWRLKTKAGTYGSHFIIDRGDNKRRRTSFLKQDLMYLEGIPPGLWKDYTIVGTEEFRGYALSYNVKE